MPVAPHRSPAQATRATQRLIVLLIGLMTMALLGLGVWQGWTAHQQARRAAEVTAANLARSLAQQANSAFEEADVALSGVVERVEADGTGPAQMPRLRQVLQNKRRFIEQLGGLFVYDQNGRWVVTSNESDPVHGTNADREYFQYHRYNPDRRPHVGPAILSRSTHEWVIPLSRRLDNVDGSFAGVALATLRLAYFNQIYAGFDLDELGVIVLTLRDGTILTRRPFDDHAVGTSLGKVRIYTDLLPMAPAGSAMAYSRIDGVERLYAYRQADRYPLVVMTGNTRAAIFAEWQANALRSAAFIGLVLAAMAICAWILLRQIRHRQKTDAELRNAYAALHKLAMQDSLTGLANRRQLDAALPDEIGRARRSGRPLGLIMLDIDYLKRYNDLYGRTAGDQCIQAIGQAALGCIGRPGDLAVRYGGEELLIVLPECDETGTRRVAEKILQAVRDLHIDHAGHDAGHVTLSAGVHVLYGNDPVQRSAGLLQQAEQALGLAKQQGRNRCCSSQPFAYHDPAYPS